MKRLPLSALASPGDTRDLERGPIAKCSQLREECVLRTVKMEPTWNRLKMSVLYRSSLFGCLHFKHYNSDS